MVNAVEPHQPDHVAPRHLHDYLIAGQELRQYIISGRVGHSVQRRVNLTARLLVQLDALRDTIERDLHAVMDVTASQQLKDVLFVTDEMTD